MTTRQQTNASARIAAGNAVSAPFVINLCSSNTPMTLAKPTTAALARFTFFVSRRREEGRERFRLHMGYFSTRDEAEQLLAAVRDVYPAAWIGAAPGQNLTAKPTAASAMPATRPAAVRPAAAAAPAVAMPARSAVTGAAAQRPAPLPRSNVREVLADLGSKPIEQAPAAAMMPILDANVPTLAQAPQTAAGETLAEPPSLSDSQVLRVLEGSRSKLAAQHRDIPVQRPQDTLTWQEIRDEVARHENVSFALQLFWSPTPIDPLAVPALAIFASYTLYAIEMQRPGKSQYGLRLGFFSDSLAARQVASYVRSEFVSVAVVPVTAGERTRAQSIGGIRLETRPTHNSSQPVEEVTLIDALSPPRSRAVAPSIVPAADTAAAGPGARVAAAAAAVATPAATKTAAKNSRSSRPRGAPRTLEETLEILGASQLSIDNGNGETINLESRERRAPAKRGSTFSKLLDRLSAGLK